MFQSMHRSRKGESIVITAPTTMGTDHEEILLTEMEEGETEVNLTKTEMIRDNLTKDETGNQISIKIPNDLMIDRDSRKENGKNLGSLVADPPNCLN